MKNIVFMLGLLALIFTACNGMRTNEISAMTAKDGIALANELNDAFREKDSAVYRDTSGGRVKFELLYTDGGEEFRVNDHAVDLLGWDADQGINPKELYAAKDFIVALMIGASDSAPTMYVFDHDGNTLFRGFYISSDGMMVTGIESVSDDGIVFAGSRFVGFYDFEPVPDERTLAACADYSGLLFESAEREYSANLYEFADDLNLFGEENFSALMTLDPNDVTDAGFEMNFADGKPGKIRLVEVTSTVRDRLRFTIEMFAENHRKDDPVIKSWMISALEERGYLSHDEALEYAAYASVDVWDGSVAESYGGAGTQPDPYRIESAVELALLAKEVNSGNDHDGEYFALTRDLDLAGLEWKPIGDRLNPFRGSFDGGRHTIFGLRVTDVSRYDWEYTRSVSHDGVAGLFGCCEDADIRALVIDGAKILIDIGSGELFGTLYAGVLCGKFTAHEKGAVSNVRVKNATMNFHARGSTLCAGVIGQVWVETAAECRIERIQADMDISFGYVYRVAYNNIGSAAGELSCLGKVDCADISGRLNLKYPESGKFSAGVFGSVTATEAPARLERIFSKISADRANLVSGEFEALIGEYETYPLIGKIYGAKDGRIELESCYGIVMFADGTRSGGLFRPPYELTVGAAGCMIADRLPDDCGFDPAVWDVSDPSDPELR